jgi:hypothetical protein
MGGHLKNKPTIISNLEVTEKTEKTLIVLLGNARGGEDTWETMYKNLKELYNADIALCFGYTENKNSSLYQIAKYIWEINEYEKWFDYFNNNFTGNWIKVFDENKHTGLMGGINNNIGSGAIIFAFRDFLLKKYRDILLTYDRIILTRSDYYYIDTHPIIDNNNFYIVEGEDYGGITDRHHIFNSKDIDNVLGICDFMCDENNHELILQNKDLNPEKILKIFFDFNGISTKLKRFKRVQFTVSEPNDSTRWMRGSSQLSGHHNLKLKYVSEYDAAIKNKNNL